MDWEKFAQLLALSQQALTAALNIYTNHQKQEGMTDEQILQSAEEKNKLALEKINAL